MSPGPEAGFWHGRTALVTGASGFIGGHLIVALSRRGAQVIASSRGATPSSGKAGEGVRWVRGDLDEARALAGACDEADVVFHLAAASLQGGTSAEVLTRANVDGTRNLVEAVGKTATHPPLILASTDRVYAPSAPLPRAETAEVRPVGDYAVSKAAAEQVVAASFRGTRTRGTVLRLSNVYGPGDPHLSRLVPGILRALAAGRNPHLRSDGSARRDFLFVEDAVSAFLAAGEAAIRAEVAGVYNVGSGQPVPTLELARLALTVAGRPDLDVELDRTVRDSSSWLDCSRIERALGWSPAVALRDGLQRTWHASRSPGEWRDP